MPLPSETCEIDKDPPPGDLDLLTVDEVAAQLKVSKSWVYEHTRSRSVPPSERLPHVKLGKYVRFDPRRVHWGGDI
jgi:excisionase family DNA binding protein